MFEIRFAGSELQQKFQYAERYYPPEVCQELRLILSILQKNGQFTRTDFYDTNTERISAETFYLFYRTNVIRKGKRILNKEVLIIDVKMKPADVLKQRFSILNEWDDKDVVASIPQYDQPRKLIRAIELIHEGTTDSHQLGHQLGHRGKKTDHVARHGNYAKHALEQLNLITRTRRGNTWDTKLTERGCLIAQSPNASLKVRLLIEAMLNYHPVWQIVTAVTVKESELGSGEVLTDDLIKNLTFPEAVRDADTSKRRSQTLRQWIKWISDNSGIPIRLYPDMVQLPIPMIYSTNSGSEDP